MANVSDKLESWLTIDKVIEKFIPVVGAISFIIWLGYLLYTSVWMSFDTELKLWIGFFMSILIIWAWFSFSEKLSYFADVVMGGWILLLYWTLIYWSRATDVGWATIPEIATLVTASFFTIAVSYFASIRKSKIILAIALLWSYLTPFVIGWEWGSSVLSFNSYLIYFLVANITIFLMWKELALRNLVPLNMLWLFFGTSSLYYLSYKTVTASSSFFDSSTFSLILIFLLVCFSVFSIVISSKYFESKDESYITIAYIVPLIWFIINVNLLNVDIKWFVVWLYILLATVYFLSWHYVRNLKYRFQHVSLYVAWVVALVMWLVKLFPDLNYISSSLIAYIGLIFAWLFFYDNEKWERYFTYLIFAIFWWLMSIFNFYDGSYTGNFGFISMIFSLFPLMISYPLLKKAKENIYNSFYHISVTATIFSFIIIILSFINDFKDIFSVELLLLIIPSFIIVLRVLLSKTMTSQNKLISLRIAMGILAFWFFTNFMYLLQMLVPWESDRMTLIWVDSIINNHYVINSFIAIITMFLWLNLSRKIQKEDKSVSSPFVLVMFSYASLILFVNHIMVVWINDLSVSYEQWWPRAVATTIWWIIVSSYMISTWLKMWKKYKAEKLLWLILFFVTLWKIVLYDLSTMDTQKKVIVLMIFWWILMMISYLFHTKEWFKLSEKEENEEDTNNKNLDEDKKIEKNNKKKIVNMDLDKIDLWDKTSISFIFNNWKKITIKAKNLIKIGIIVIEKSWKNTFEKWELMTTYDYIKNNYESELSERDYNKIITIIEEFIEIWWSIEIK